MDKVKGKIVFISHYYWPPHFGGELRIAIERLEELVKKRVYGQSLYIWGGKGLRKNRTTEWDQHQPFTDDRRRSYSQKVESNHILALVVLASAVGTKS